MKNFFSQTYRSLAMLVMMLALAMPSFSQQPTLPKNSDGYYIINSDEDYETFRQIVATGNPYANAVLTADVTARKPIGDGDEQFHYRGIFNGQGHTVTMNGMAASGLFAFTMPDCVIRNLKVSGTLTSKSTYVGSIVGSAIDTRIENCISDATLEGANVGGIIGTGYGVNDVENCAFIGKIKSTVSGAGIIANNPHLTNIKSCYIAADFTESAKNNTQYFTLQKDTRCEALFNNYYCKDESGTAGPSYISEKLITNDCIASGELCYLLNTNGKAGVVWYQHGKYPYPFKGTDGDWVYKDDYNNTSFHVGGTCYCTRYVVGEVCNFCGNIIVSSHVEPLQVSQVGEGDNSGLHRIGNLWYILNDADHTATVKRVAKPTGAALGSKGIKALHVPETINVGGVVYTVNNITNYAFNATQEMEYVYIPKSMTRIENDAFNGCEGLKYVHLADGPSNVGLWLGYRTAGFNREIFVDSEGLEKVYVGRNLCWDGSENAPFESRTQLKYLFWGPRVTRIGNSRYGNDLFCNHPELFSGSNHISKIYYMGDEASTTEMDLRTFVESGCNHATEFYVNRNIYMAVDEETQIRTTDYVFKTLQRGQTIAFGPFVNYIGREFFYHGIFNTIDMNNAFNLHSIEELAFFAFKGTHSLTVPKYVTKIAGNAFNESNIKELYIEYSPEALKIEGDKGLEQELDDIFIDRRVNNGHIGAGLWTIGPNIDYLSDDLFADRGPSRVILQYSKDALWCKKNIKLMADLLYIDREVVNADDPSVNNNIQFIKNSASSMKALNFGSHFTEIHANMFQGQTALTSLIIPETVTRICDGAFKGCKNLEVVSIMGEPTVGESAFDNSSEDGTSTSKLKYLFLMGKKITLGLNAFNGNPNIKEIFTGFYEDPGPSSAIAFDNSVKSEAVLSCAGDQDSRYGKVEFTSNPWNLFFKHQALVQTYIYSNTPEQPLKDQLYNRATMSHHFPVGGYDMIYLPFDMDSYYFGIDAEIYRLMKLHGKYMNYFSEQKSYGKTYGVSDVLFEKINIDEEKTLSQGYTYLVKVNHAEDSFSGYYNLFDSEKISVNNSQIVSSGTDTSGSTILEGDNVETLTGTDGAYVSDNGVLKLVNGEYTPQQGRVLMLGKINDNEQKVFNLIDEDNESILMTSKSDLTFSGSLEGYSSFYNADYNFVAPEWCDVYVVKSIDRDNIIMEQIADRTITAGQAVLIKSNKIDDATENDFTEYLTYATHGSTSTAYSGNMLKGLSESKQVSDLGCDFVYVLSCNSQNEDTGFYKLRSDKKMPAGKAYLAPNDIDSSLLSKACLFVCRESEATDITTPVTTNHKLKGVYDIMGRCLKEAGHKGLYIVNGQKVVIK